MGRCGAGGAFFSEGAVMEVSHASVDVPHPCTYGLSGLLKKKKKRREVGRSSVGGICEELEGERGGIWSYFIV